jgi:hypothetical protein
MSIRAKFYVAECTMTPGNGGGGKVKLSAVSRGSRNADWASATPSGTIEMFVNNPKAFDWFVGVLKGAEGTGIYPEVFIDFNVSTDGLLGDGHAFVAAELPENHYLHGKCAECGSVEEAH